MRHIKLFENYDNWNYGSITKIKQDIEDIFIESIDNKFCVSVQIVSDISVYVEHIENDWFFFDEIYESVLMMIDYVESEFNDVKINYDYEEYNTPGPLRSKEIYDNVMNKKDKHVLFSYFSISFTTGNKKLE